MKSYCLLDALFVILFVFSCRQSVVSAESGPQRLSVADGKQQIRFAHAGQPVELVCPLEPSDALTFVEWTLGGRVLYMEPGYTITSRGALRIRAVAPHHAGTYTCEGVNGYGFVPVNITLIVDNPEVENVNFTGPNQNSVHRNNIIPPTIKKRSSGAPVSVEVGGEVTFHCVASGHPRPHLFWFRNGHLLEADSYTVAPASKGRVHSTLRLRRVEQSALYKCIARNKGGEDHVDYSLLVTDVPKPPQILSVEPPEAVIKEGEPAIFWCVVNSKPGLKLHIKWLKKLNSDELGTVDSEKVFRSGSTMYRPLQITEDPGTSSGQNKAKLLIRNSLEQDSGTYVCLALNDKGFNFRNVSLTVVKTVLKASRFSYFPSGGTSLIISGSLAILIIFGIFFLVLYYCRSRRTPCSFGPPEGVTIRQEPFKDPQVKCKLICDSKGQTVREKTYILT